MAIDHGTDKQALQGSVLERLPAERGIDRYGLCLMTGEGEEMPGGGETASGYVVDRSGRVFFFWLDWDPKRGQPGFSTWRDVRSDADWLEEPEYRNALAKAGVVAP